MTVVMYTERLLVPGEAERAYPYRSKNEYFAALCKTPCRPVRVGESVVGWVEDFRIDGNRVLGTFRAAREAEEAVK